MHYQLICTLCGKRCGLDEPKLIAVQAEGCSSIAESYQKRMEKVMRVRNPKTIAQGIDNPYPPRGNHVLREQRGFVNCSISPKQASLS